MAFASPAHASILPEEAHVNTPTQSAPPATIIVLGGGPNRIGQGIEFDYCCVHASYAIQELGYESVIVNSNPETVSTDYDTSTRLYFEPLTREDVLAIVRRENPLGVIVQLGGQTPLNLAVPLEKAGVPILGTSPDSIDRAEDRERFRALLEKLKLLQPPNATVDSQEEAKKVARDIGYPVIVRPSYVLGGRAMEIVYDDQQLEKYMLLAVTVTPEHPVLVDKFLEDAIEVDVDAVADGNTAVIGGILEHIEEAGVHSGDSAMALPPYSIGRKIIDRIREQTLALALELKVKGLMNVQFAIKDNLIYVLEVNPRASRTVPFVSKATGVPLANLATKVMCGKTLAELEFTKEIKINHVAVKESVFPFARFPGVDTILGPEMKSTGEVMGIDTGFELAFAKSQLAAGSNLPLEGTVFISLRDKDKRIMIPTAKRIVDLGFRILATEGTKEIFDINGIPADRVLKVSEGRPNITDYIKNHEVHLIINTPSGKTPKQDEVAIRATAVAYNIPLITTTAGAAVAVGAIEALRKKGLSVKSIQEYHEEIRNQKTG